MSELSAANAKLVQYLNEAYGTEKRLETALEAHIGMTTHTAYRKRLKEHLTETKRHGREVKQRIKKLGGEAETISTPGPDQVGGTARALLGGAQKAVALAQGPLHALRGTGEDEKQLKNAKTEYASESEEIATYTAIETLAEVLGDKDTQRLARAILRDEERMRKFLEKEIPRLTKAVAKAEIPASQRGGGTGRARAKSASKRRSSTAVQAKAAVKRRSPVKQVKRAKAKAATKRPARAAASSRASARSRA
jgi:ferritin-like metal-binding protein YciE